MIDDVPFFFLASLFWAAVCAFVSQLMLALAPSAPRAVAAIMIAALPPFAVFLTAPAAAAPALSGLLLRFEPLLSAGAAAFGAAPEEAAQGAFALSAGGLLAAIYAAGFLFRIAGLGAEILKVRRILRHGAVFDHPAVGRIVVGDGAASAFSFGALRPQVFIPASFVSSLTEAQLAFVCAHEKRHADRGDGALFLALAFIDAAFWFNPFMRRLTNGARLAAEIACDDDVLRAGQAERRAYAETLMQCLKSAKSSGAGAPAIFNLNMKGDYEMRLTRILSASPSKSKLATASLFALCILGGPASLAGAVAGNHPAFVAALGAAAAGEAGEAELEEAFRLSEAGDSAGALAVYDRMIARKDISARARALALQMRAALRVNAGDLDGAEGDFNEAIDSGGLDEDEAAELAFYRAQTQLQNGDYRRAADGFDAYAEKNRDDAEPLALAAIAYLRLEELETARERAEAALRIDPQNNNAKGALAAIDAA
jgi:tetratricopeptide (TPR) repeat protein